ncbi:MAG: carboxypeptidase regulatory-like domain-containing protein [Acidobacteria bacterium]|nr:carboxypeptidase regulatory-like domain-containing protein [Acidobacteriota bacterium]
MSSGRWFSGGSDMQPPHRGVCASPAGCRTGVVVKRENHSATGPMPRACQSDPNLPRTCHRPATLARESPHRAPSWESRTAWRGLVPCGTIATVMHRGTCFAIGIALALLTAQALVAQTGTGRIQGTVKDATGAVIPAARVSVMHTQTARLNETITNEVGFYLFPSLLSGDYTITVTAAGMDTWKGQLLLQTGQAAVVDAMLNVSGTATEVTVAANVAPLVTTTAPTLAAITDRARIDQLPVSGRMFQVLMGDPEERDPPADQLQHQLQRLAVSIQVRPVQLGAEHVAVQGHPGHRARVLPAEHRLLRRAQHAGHPQDAQQLQRADQRHVFRQQLPRAPVRTAADLVGEAFSLPQPGGIGLLACGPMQRETGLEAYSTAADAHGRDRF